MILLKQMLIFLIIMVIGYAMTKKGIWHDETSKVISWLIVNIANPALIVLGSIGNTIDKSKLLYILGISVGMYVLMIAIAELMIPLFHFEKKAAAVYKILLVFTNVGFMGFPILSAMYGSEALLYAAVFLIPFDFLIYTYGIFRIRGGMENAKELIRNCLNPGTIAVVVTMVIALWGIELPYVVTQTVTMLSNLTGPLCMIVIGASFAKVPIKEAFCDGKMILFSVLRLLVMPVIFMLFLRIATGDELLRRVAFIVIATPSGSMGAMFAQQYDGDYLTAAKGVAVTTLLSVATMPLLFELFQLN